MEVEGKEENRKNREKVFEMGFWIRQKDTRLFDKRRDTEGKTVRKSGE